jgi:peptidoglycan/xylan/chitin deacetylase (PgdA/CDA1 family)
LFSGNREFHREFGQSISPEVQGKHLKISQQILEDWFETEVITFVPPGNQFSETTLTLAAEHGLRIVSCRSAQRTLRQIVVIGNANVLPFHDREIVYAGPSWLSNLLEENINRHFCFVRDLIENS